MSQYGWCGTRFPPPYPQYHNSIECQEYEPALKRQRTISISSNVTSYFDASSTNVLSIINLSNHHFIQTTIVDSSSSQEIIASQELESADDYIFIDIVIQNNHNYISFSQRLWSSADA